MSGTWPGFTADWEESSEYQEAFSRDRLRRKSDPVARALRERRNRENLKRAAERLVARGQTGNADQLALAIDNEGEGTMREVATCEDRGYRCCETDDTPAEERHGDEWYDAHVARYEALSGPLPRALREPCPECGLPVEERPEHAGAVYRVHKVCPFCGWADVDAEGGI